MRVDILVADLTVENAATTLREQVPALGLQVELLINNAGFATAGRFELLDPAADHAPMLNVVTGVDLAHQFLSAMAQRGNGAVINVAQIGGFHEVARAGSPAGPVRPDDHVVTQRLVPAGLGVVLLSAWALQAPTQAGGADGATPGG